MDESAITHLKQYLRMGSNVALSESIPSNNLKEICRLAKKHGGTITLSYSNFEDADLKTAARIAKDKLNINF